MRICHSIGLFAVVSLATSCSSQKEWGADVIDQTYVHKYGVEVPPDYWDSAGHEGSVITTMSDGVVVMNTYSNGALEGDTTYTFPHSDRLQRAEVYHNGQREKETIYFYEGTPMQAIEYAPSSSQKNVTTWYSAGTPKSYETYERDHLLSGEYYTLTNQKDSIVENFEGTRVIRDDYGQLVSRDMIHQGNLTMSTTYHPNGAPKEVIPYKDDQVEGLKKTFHPGGEPCTIETWRGDQQEGMTTIFQNGEKYADIPYRGGQKFGVERRYKDEDIVVQEILWVNDQMHGPTKTYVGDAVKTEWYFEGEPKTKGEFDFLSTRPSPNR